MKIVDAKSVMARLPEPTAPCELVVNLDHVAFTFGLDKPKVRLLARLFLDIEQRME